LKTNIDNIPQQQQQQQHDKNIKLEQRRNKEHSKTTEQIEDITIENKH
jgi:hypothetical protein